jgi:hypothetical protein
VYGLARALRVRPSELLGVSDPLAAFSLDRAVIYWGSTVDEALQNAEAEANNPKAAATKRAMVMNRYLGIQKFRDPAAEGPKKVRTS